VERVLLVVAGNFPTIKAYGVTTSQTIKNIESRGHKVACAAFRPIDEIPVHSNGAEMLYFEERGVLPYFRKYAYAGFGRIAQIFWRLTCHFALSNLPKFVTKFEPTIIWVRDSIPYSLLRMSRPNITFVIELHDLVKKRTVAQISKLSQNRVILAPISPSIHRDLESYQLPFKIVFSPMGVDLAQFKNREEGHQEIGRPLKIGYFGKLAPSGYSKGYEDLLELGAFHQTIDFPSIIQLVGAADSEIEYLRQYAQRLNLKSGQFEFESHKRHQETISLMHKCDILVLTTPASKRYHGSPIKAIEYAATGKPILAARSSVNEDVFNGNVAPYWYTPGDITNMHEAVLQIMNDPNRELIAGRMRDFAESRTWRVRTERILDQVVMNRKGL